MEINYKQKLINIKAFIFDVDGVLTDGSLLISETGELLRTMKYSFQVMGFPANMNVNQFFDEAKKTIETLRVSIDK